MASPAAGKPFEIFFFRLVMCRVRDVLMPGTTAARRVRGVEKDVFFG